MGWTYFPNVYGGVIMDELYKLPFLIFLIAVTCVILPIMAAVVYAILFLAMITNGIALVVIWIVAMLYALSWWITERK